MKSKAGRAVMFVLYIICVIVITYVLLLEDRLGFAIVIVCMAILCLFVSIVHGLWA